MDKNLKKIAIIIPVIILMFTANFGFAHEYVFVDYEVLGVDSEKLGTLPNNLFYFTKEWGRGFSMMFASGDLAKAKLEFGILNQKAAEALKVSENVNDQKGIIKALNNYEKSSKKLMLRIQSLSQNSNAKDVVAEIAEKLEMHNLLLGQLAERYFGLPRYDEIKNMAEKGKSQTLENITVALEGNENITNKAELEISNLEKNITELKKEINSLNITFAEPTGVQATSGCNVNILPDCSNVNGKIVGFACVDDMWQCAYFPEAMVFSINKNLFTQSEGGRVKAEIDTDYSGDQKIIVKDDTALNILFQIYQNANNILPEAENELNGIKSAFDSGKYGRSYGMAMSIDVQVENALRRIVQGLSIIK